MVILEGGWWATIEKHKQEKNEGVEGLLLQTFRGVEEQQGGGPVAKTGARTPLLTTYGLGTKVGKLNRESHGI